MSVGSAGRPKSYIESGIWQKLLQAGDDHFHYVGGLCHQRFRKRQQTGLNCLFSCENAAHTANPRCQLHAGCTFSSGCRAWAH